MISGRGGGADHDTPSEQNIHLNIELDNESDSKECNSSDVSSVDSVENFETFNDSDDKIDDEEEIEDEGINEMKHWRNMEWNADTKKFCYSDTAADIDSQAIPSVEEWNKIHPRDMTRLRVTFDKARESMIGVIKAEYDALEFRLEALNIEKTSEGLIEYLF